MIYFTARQRSSRTVGTVINAVFLCVLTYSVVKFGMEFFTLICRVEGQERNVSNS